MKHDCFGCGDVMVCGEIMIDGRRNFNSRSVTRKRYRDEVLQPYVRLLTGAFSSDFFIHGR